MIKTGYESVQMNESQMVDDLEKVLEDARQKYKRKYRFTKKAQEFIPKLEAALKPLGIFDLSAIDASYPYGSILVRIPTKPNVDFGTMLKGMQKVIPDLEVTPTGSYGSCSGKFKGFTIYLNTGRMTNYKDQVGGDSHLGCSIDFMI